MNKQQFDIDLDKCNTFADVLNLFNKYFDLENTKIGYITKRVISSNLTTILKSLNVKERK